MPARPKRQTIDYSSAAQLLSETFSQAEAQIREGRRSPIGRDLVAAADLLFASKTQSYREVLVGCALAKLADSEINLRTPYVEQGPHAYSGRQINSRVVNPFLIEKEVPCSKNPYLNTFRRGVRFVPGLPGQKDRKAYDAFLSYISALEASPNRDVRTDILRYLLIRFVDLRDKSRIPLSRVQRLSVEQYDALLDALLETPSGGLLPVLLAVANFEVIGSCFGLNWKVDWQGINVADAASGAGGDITISRDRKAILTVEVSLQPIDRTRVVSTFSTKILPNGIEDYLFLFSTNEPTADARAAARVYFAQGHEINFASLKSWIMTTLTTIGAKCRPTFTESLVKLLSRREVPANLKVAWNDSVSPTSPIRWAATRFSAAK